MKWLWLAVLMPPLLLAGAVFAVRWWARRWAERAERENLLGQFDSGLAIPMRDSDTRRNSRRSE